MIWLYLHLAALAADTTFFPNASDERIDLSELSSTAGLRLQLTQHIVVRAEAPTQLARVPGVTLVRLLGSEGHVARLTLEPDADVLEVSRRLHGRPDVTWAHPDFVIPRRLHYVPNDPGIARQWHLSNVGEESDLAHADIDGPSAWDITDGSGQIIAILDSGVDVDHPDLDVIPGIDMLDGDRDPSPADGNAHGTASAGVAAARGDNNLGVAGVAYGAQVYGIRLIGSGDSISDTYTAFVDAVDAGAGVLSNSWGFGDSCPDTPRLGVLDDAAEYAENKGRGGLGAAVLVASGNDNCDFSNDGWQQIETLISVGATNRRDQRENYSNFGSLLDIVAPSGDILTTDISGEAGYGDWQGDVDYYPNYSGTSAATPVVAGTIALMFAANERLTAEQARRVLCETATRVDVDNADYDETGWSPWYGCGRVDAGAAVRAVANQAPVASAIDSVFGAYREGERTVLTWPSATDPDGDRLTYEVDVYPDGRPRRGVTYAVDGTSLDITEDFDGPLLWEWRVTPVDAWGRGVSSEPMLLAIPKDLPAPAPSKACGSARPAALLIWCACVPWLRRRRRHHQTG